MSGEQDLEIKKSRWTLVRILAAVVVLALAALIVHEYVNLLAVESLYSNVIPYI
jgi:hypothetical protein